MEYRGTDSYLRDVKTVIRREELKLDSAYDALVSAYVARDVDSLTVEDVQLLARSAYFTDRESDIMDILEAYTAEVTLSRRTVLSTTWPELEQQLEYVQCIEDDERRDAVAKRAVKRGLQGMTPIDESLPGDACQSQ